MRSPPSRARARVVRGVLAILFVGLAWFGCSEQADELTGPAARPGDFLQDLNPAMDVQRRHTPQLMDIPGVVGTAVGLTEDGHPVVKVFTINDHVQGIPESLEGLPVRTQVTGMFQALTNPAQRQPRPVPTGVSTGHPAVTAGTIGARVRDGAGNVYVLSNNHVLANQNDASIGDAALQPGTYDGGQDPADRIGTLHDFQSIVFTSTANNTIDAAIALSTISDLGFATPADDGYGAPSSTTVPAYIGQPVQKYGRTTKLTQGEVTDLNVTVNVCYEVLLIFCVKSARFVGQIGISGPGFSGGGDSGSLIVTGDGNRNPVALLFAGSDTYTLANPIDLVLDRFNVTIDDGSGGTAEPVPDIAVSAVSAAGSATQGDAVPVSVTVRNVGGANAGADFTVTLADATDAQTIGAQTVAGGLAAGASTTLDFSWGTAGSSIGEHTLTASHDFADANSGNDSRSAVVTISTEPAPATGMHIGDLFPYNSNEGSSWTAYVIVRVHDSSHDPVEGATVYGSWTGGGLAVDECTTDYAGECLMLSTLMRRNVKRATYTTTNVIYPGLTYTPVDNHDADGDSDGTSITINRP
jgi:hypothetical protein